VKVKELESILKEQQEQIKHLQNQVRAMQDIEEIKKLQRSYGYYLQYYMAEEIMDCFADHPDVAVNFVGQGWYLGREGVRKCFEPDPEKQSPPHLHEVQSPELMHVAMQLSPVINVDADGQNARGRWYGMLECAVPMGKGIFYRKGVAIYENDYLKQNGKWKIKILRLAILYGYRPLEGFVNRERILEVADPDFKGPPPGFDKLDNVDPMYPSGYIIPFHFQHPVTGKKTSDEARNASLKNTRKSIPKGP
jgi:hypothetical protein